MALEEDTAAGGHQVAALHRLWGQAALGGGGWGFSAGSEVLEGPRASFRSLRFRKS